MKKLGFRAGVMTFVKSLISNKAAYKGGKEGHFWGALIIAILAMTIALIPTLTHYATAEGSHFINQSNNNGLETIYTDFLVDLVGPDTDDRVDMSINTVINPTGGEVKVLGGSTSSDQWEDFTDPLHESNLVLPYQHTRPGETSGLVDADGNPISQVITDYEIFYFSNIMLANELELVEQTYIPNLLAGRAYNENAPVGLPGLAISENLDAEFDFALDSESTGYVITNYKGDDTAIRIPSTYHDLSVVGLDDFLFQNQPITRLELPDTIQTIGISAFEGCTALSNIIIPKSVVEIGADAFANCPNLTIFLDFELVPETWDENWNPDPDSTSEEIGPRPIYLQKSWQLSNNLPQPIIFRDTSFTVFSRSFFATFLYNKGNGNPIAQYKGFYNQMEIDSGLNSLAYVTIDDVLYGPKATAEARDIHAPENQHLFVRYQAGVLNKFLAFYDLGYLDAKMVAFYGVNGVTYAIYLGMILLLALVIFLLTRGKNNPMRFLTFADTAKMTAWLSFTPGLLSLFGFLIGPTFTPIIFVLTLTLRTMFFNFKTLKPQGAVDKDGKPMPTNKPLPRGKG